ncbi:MAG: flippase, partial [Candidatus Nanohalobium sp.]
MQDRDEKDSALRSIVKGAGVMFVATLSAKSLALLYRLMTGRFLGPTDYGVITLMMGVYSTVTTFAFLGFHQGVQKYVSDYRGKEKYSKIKGTIHSGLIMVLASSSLLGILLFLSSGFIAYEIFKEPLSLWPIRFVAVSLPFLGATKVLTNVGEGYENMKPTAYTGQISVNVIKVVLTAIAIYAGFGYLGAAFSFSFSVICGGVIAYYFYRKVTPDEVLESTPEYNFKELGYFSVPLVAGGVFGVISNQIDTYMIQYFIGTTSVGLYNAAYPFALLIFSFSSIFYSVFMSSASKLKSKGKEGLNADIFRTLTKWVSIVAVPIFLVIFLFPRTALLLFGNEYYQASKVLSVLSVGFLASSLTGPVNNIYQAYDRTELNFLTSAMLGVSNLILNYLFIVPLDMGILGAAYATTASFLIVAAFNLLMSYRFLGRPPLKLKTFKVWIIGGISIFLPWSLSNYLFTVTPKWFFIIDLGMFGGLYAAMIAFSGVLERDDKMIVE